MYTLASEKIFNGALQICAPVVLPKIDWVWEEDLSSYSEDIRKQYAYDEDRHCWVLPEPAWQEWRSHGPYGDVDFSVTGSAVSAVLSQAEFERIHLYDGQVKNRYMSIAEYFKAKAGEPLPLSEKEEGSDVFAVGHIEEESVRQLFAREYRKTYPEDEIRVINETHMFQSGKYNFMLCDPDGTVEITTDHDGERVTVKGLLECKTVRYSSPDFAVWAADRVPWSYYVQTQFYMDVMDLPFGYICVKTGVGEVKFFYIERNLSVGKIIEGACVRFHDLLVAGKKPDLSGVDAKSLDRYYREAMGNYSPKNPVAKLPTDSLAAVKTVGDLLKKKAAIVKEEETVDEEIQKLLVDKIYPSYGDAKYAEVPDSDGTTWRIALKSARSKSKVFDVEALKTKDASVYEKYKTTPKFNETLFKKENPSLYEECLVPNKKLGKSTPTVKHIGVDGKEVI